VADVADTLNGVPKVPEALGVKPETETAPPLTGSGLLALVGCHEQVETPEVVLQTCWPGWTGAWACATGAKPTTSQPINPIHFAHFIALTFQQ
jgi:hypothetical protein